MAEDSPQALLSDREEAILRALVDEYIREGSPIGSRTLSKRAGIALSAASIRNVMGDLEELGLLRAPHTSAGRVPTEQAYRLFVDHMVQYQPLKHASIDALRQHLSADLNREQLIARASEYLSGMTHMAGLVFAPRPAEETLRQIEFVPLSEQRALVILVTNDHDVQNRVVSLDRDYSADELSAAARFITAKFGGLSLYEVRKRLLDALEDLRDDMASQMEHMITVAGQVLAAPDRDTSGDYAVAGQTNLMGVNAASDVEHLRTLFDTFNNQRDMYHLFERCMGAEGVRVFIGAEAGHEVLDKYSLVSAPCEVDGEVLGVLGVIGPTRMAYDRVVPVVDVTSKILGAALNSNR
ncbi:MAG: heat-inducible transcriptional repressor HrcA [Pseudomonadota bacterium]